MKLQSLKNIYYIYQQLCQHFPFDGPTNDKNYTLTLIYNIAFQLKLVVQTNYLSNLNEYQIQNKCIKLKISSYMSVQNHLWIKMER